MNTLSKALGITCSVDIGLTSLNYTCFDGDACFPVRNCIPSWITSLISGLVHNVIQLINRKYIEKLVKFSISY